MVDVGDDAPDFRLLDTDRNIVTGVEHKGRKVVLAFFPASFTGVCTKEMCTFQDSHARLDSADATILGICVDSPFSNGAFATSNGISFPILSDYERLTIRAYGIAHEDFAGMEGYTASKRAIFVVDEDGDVSYKWVADVPSEEPNYEVIMAHIES